MQFKLVALLTLVAASVNGAALGKRSGELRYTSSLSRLVLTLDSRILGRVLVGPTLLPIPRPLLARGGAVASLAGE